MHRNKCTNKSQKCAKQMCSNRTPAHAINSTTTSRGKIGPPTATKEKAATHFTPNLSPILAVTVTATAKTYGWKSNCAPAKMLAVDVALKSKAKHHTCAYLL